MFGVSKFNLIRNLTAFLPYSDGDFVEGTSHDYYYGYIGLIGPRFIRGIVTGFELEGGMLVCRLTDTTGHSRTILATRAKKIENLTKRKPGPEKELTENAASEQLKD